MNLYAYTKQEFIDLAAKYNGLMVKVGCTARDPRTRISEQQSTSDATAPIILGAWYDVAYESDSEVHDMLRERGCTSPKLNGAGTEWFLLQHVYTTEQAANFLSSIINASIEKEKKQGFWSWLINLLAEAQTGHAMSKGNSKMWRYMYHSKGFKVRK